MNEKEFSLIVYGIPIAQGSKRAFYKKGMKHAVVVEDNSKVKPWRQEIATCALEAMRNAHLKPALAGCAVAVECSFFFLRPKSLNKSIKHKTTKPDVDKLARAVLDALTGTAFADDGQVVLLAVKKRFADVPRCEIRVVLLLDGPVFKR